MGNQTWRDFFMTVRPPSGPAGIRSAWDCNIATGAGSLRHTNNVCSKCEFEPERNNAGGVWAELHQWGGSDTFETHRNPCEL